MAWTSTDNGRRLMMALARPAASRWHRLGETGPKIRFALCAHCRLRHYLAPPDIDARLSEFAARHVGHAVTLLNISEPDEYLSMLAFAPSADIKEAFGTSAFITCTLASLAQNPARESASIDNASNLFLDALVRLHAKLQTGTPASDKRHRGVCLRIGRRDQLHRQHDSQRRRHHPAGPDKSHTNRHHRETGCAGC